MVFNKIRVVLIETSHPGNIGAAARAMKTMGVDRLYLVNPRDYPNAEATARASGADDVLAKAQVVSSLEDAVAGCQLVAGASARLRSVDWPQLNPRECAELVVAETQVNEVAIVFGRERTGLTNEELDCCHYLVNIPSNPDYSSLNLAAAVQVLCYEIRMAACLRETAFDQSVAEPLASVDEMESFYAHMETALLEIGFFKPPNYNKLLRRLRRIYNRSRLTRIELDILRGILSAAQGRKYQWMRESGLISGEDIPIQDDESLRKSSSSK